MFSLKGRVREIGKTKGQGSLKGQELGLKVRTWLPPGIRKNGENPVSYTHLDVYKRQVFSISFYDTGIREFIGLHIRLTLYEIVGNINNIILNRNALEFPS